MHQLGKSPLTCSPVALPPNMLAAQEAIESKLVLSLKVSAIFELAASGSDFREGIAIGHVY